MPDGLGHSEPTLAQDAALAAAMLAVDPIGLGGAVLRGRAGGLQENWLAVLRELVPGELALHRLPGIKLPLRQAWLHQIKSQVLHMR